MLKYFSKLFFLAIAFPVSLFSQKNGEKQSPVRILKSPDGYMYTDNTTGAYFCIDFKGDSISDAGVENGFKIDDHIFQVILNTYTTAEYNFNTNDSARETALLKSKMQSELDYISKEVFKKPIVSNFEIFKNKDGKNYFLWHYISPAAKRKDSSDILVTQSYILTFIANQHVVGITTPVFEGEKTEERKNNLKQLADRIDVLGARIDVEGLYYKLDARADGKDLEYVDSANRYTLTIREWFNITESPGNSIYMGTLPDIDNIQNAILVRPVKKTNYASFSDFNEKILPADLKSGDKFGGGTFLLKKDLPRPSLVNGLSRQITVQRGSQLYENHYITIETASCYMTVVFTATSKTFGLNQPRFLEFVDDIVLMK